MSGSAFSGASIAEGVNRGKWSYFCSIVEALKAGSDAVASPEHARKLDDLILNPPRVMGIVTCHPVEEVPEALVRCRADVGLTEQAALGLVENFRDFCWQDKPNLWYAYGGARRAVDRNLEELNTADSTSKQIGMRFLGENLAAFVNESHFQGLPELPRILELNSKIQGIVKEYAAVPSCPDGWKALFFYFTQTGLKAEGAISELNEKHNPTLKEVLTELKDQLQSIGMSFRKARQTSSSEVPAGDWCI